MNNISPFIFYCPTRIEFGENLSISAAECLQTSGGSKVLIICDEGLIKTGVVAPILNSFQEQGMIAHTFSDVPSDSDLSCVNQAVALGQAANCNAVLAVGGGSVLDTAKVVNICLSLGGNPLEHQGMNNLTRRLLPSLAIPTTAGTGSEVSQVAMIKDAKEGRKLLFGSRFLAYDTAILDPLLLVSLPAKLTAATGLDAVTHGIEAYSAEAIRSPITDALCLESLRLLFNFLPQATKCGDDLAARANTLVAASMAGMAFTNAGVGIVHALTHTIGGQFSTHHGATNAVFLPHGMRFNFDVVAHRYASVARYLKFSDNQNDQTAAKIFITKVEELIAAVGLPTRLRDLGVPNLAENQIAELAYLATLDSAIMFNPKEASSQDMVNIYKRAY